MGAAARAAPRARQHTAPWRALSRFLCTQGPEGSALAVLDKPEAQEPVAAAADAAPAVMEAAPAAPPAPVLPTFYEAMSFSGYAPETVRKA